MTPRDYPRPVPRQTDADEDHGMEMLARLALYSAVVVVLLITAVVLWRAL